MFFKHIIESRREAKRQQVELEQHQRWMTYVHEVTDNYSKRCKEEGLVFGSEF
jgi:hypothetical protein